MRGFLIAVVVVHGLLHLMGFFKAFKIVEIAQLNQDISKPLGILWLFSALLFFVLVILISARQEWWWVLAIAGVITSQLLIFLSWPEASFGTIPNMIILIAIILGIGEWNFHVQTNREIATVLTQSKITDQTIITKERLSLLPPSVEKWLTNIGMIGQEEIHTVFLKQTGLMRLRPEQKNESKVEAEQYITTHQPAFLWRAKMSLTPFIDVTGWDLFTHGHGQLKMNLASLIPVVHAANPKIDQSSLQRFLLELPWYPSVALSPYVTWQSNDIHSATATMTYQGISGSATFFFDDQGYLWKSSALRFKDSDENARPIECIGEVKEYGIFEGIKIPTQMDVSWMLEDGKFTWYKLEIQQVIIT